MKTRGRQVKQFSELDLKMIHEYLDSDLSYKEVAAKYPISDAGLRYKVNKYKKQQEELNVQESE